MNSVECQHSVTQSQFLATVEQVHLEKPETHAMLACLFLCKGCGRISSSNIEVIRGYLPTGDIPPELKKYIEQRRLDLATEKRAHAIAQQMIKENSK